ncbi:MAG TPA: hypothetical protein VHD56_10610, partial [Tepidisphaeraceae bacterium]|nr:hypothetical protein [Tepidisphaeraceae bacterium]
MKRGLGFVAVVLLSMVTAIGCGKSETGTPSAAGGKKKIVIGIVAKSQSNPVFQAAHKGAKDAAAELGPKYGVEVEIDIRTPTDED